MWEITSNFSDHFTNKKGSCLNMQIIPLCAQLKLTEVWWIQLSKKSIQWWFIFTCFSMTNLPCSYSVKAMLITCQIKLLQFNRIVSVRQFCWRTMYSCKGMKIQSAMIIKYSSCLELDNDNETHGEKGKLNTCVM